MKILGPFIALAAIATLHAGSQEPQKPAKVKFWDDVMPVIKAECLVCHQGENAKAGLDLSSPKAIEESGIIKPGNPKESELVNRLKGINGPSMPLGFRPLSAEKVLRIERWIAEGASMAGRPTPHWAYVKPTKPQPPASDANPIDAFIKARLKREGLKPSPEADRETLIRRVSLDLTGLPPTVAEVDQFLADKSPNAYEKIVDRLLASPHYGEHVARYWLDLARYADTNGYEADRTRQAYLYRDWLINALNANMPFDKFTIQQLAGDLLPNPSLAQKIATGFHRNSMMNEEGGVDAEEQMYQTIVDRVNTTSTVWMASTMACTRCHDHKFDPFTQKDYYGMFAYFGNNVFDEVGDVNVGQRKFYERSIKVADANQQKQIDEVNEAIAVVDSKLKSSDGLSEAMARWLKSGNPNWRTVKPDAWACADTTLVLQPDNSLLASGKNPPNTTYRVKLKLDKPVTGIAIRALPDDSFPAKGPGRATSGNFILSAFRIEQAGKRVPISSATATFTQGGYSIEFSAFGNGPGWAVSPQYGVEHVAGFGLEQPLSGEVELSLEFNNSQWKEHTVGRFAIAVTEDEIPRVEPDNIKMLRSNGGSNPEDKARLEGFFRSVWPVTAVLSREKVRLQSELSLLENSLPSAMILLDKPGAKKAQVRDRGMYKSVLEEVDSTTPAFLAPPASKGGDRLVLARWLVSKDNPLTARVQVNRMWEMHFGRGLVETSEDFGTQGAKPSHPELLDWLAVTFMERGWDIKSMHKLMVMSQTYRQSSHSSKALNERDPQNILLARGPRFRLDAEAIRDMALRASGLLDERIGGPSAMPYQPEGVWNSPYSGERWTQHDEHRRGLYTFWKRTATYPSFAAMDAMSREECVPRRARTNTPLQALAMLNDQAMLEAARALGTRMAAVGDPAKGIDLGFRHVLSRRPTAAEQKLMGSLFNSLKLKYGHDPEAAKKLGGNAPWTLVANVLLNLDEAITKS